MINKDRYQYNPSQPSIRQPSFELYEAIDNLRNQPVYVCVIVVPASSDAKQRAYRLRQLNHLGQLTKGLQHLKHKHLAQVLEAAEEKERLMLVVESCEFGPVSTFLSQVGFLEEHLAVQFMRDVCEAVAWLHQQNVVHGYLNVDGLEIDAEGMVRLSPKRLVLHKNHLAPEFKLDSKRTQKGDIFAMGVILYKLLFGVYPFDGANDTQLNRNIKEGAYHEGSVVESDMPLQIIVSSHIRKLFKDMLQFDPAKRPTAEEVLARLGSSLAQPTEEKNKRFPKEVDADYFVFSQKQLVQHGPYYRELIFTGISRSQQEFVRIKVIPINKQQDETKLVYAYINKLEFFKKEEVQDHKKTYLKQSFVKVLQHFLTSNSLIVVMEYCNQGSLAEHEDRRKEQQERIDTATVDEIMLYCTDALEFYQEEVEPYCWLQPNTLTISSGRIKIDVPPLEFHPLRRTMTQMLSTHDYLAPEKKSNRPTETSDVWSVAMVKYWLMTSEFPAFDREGQYKVPRHRNFPPNENLFFSHALKDNPLKRRSLADLRFNCPPTQKIAGYYGIPESEVPVRNTTIDTTIDQPPMHSEANEQAQLKSRLGAAKPAISQVSTQKFPEMSWLENFLYRKSARSSLQKRNYFRAISERTNSSWRAVCKTICASVLLLLLFYLYFFMDAGVLLVHRNSYQPLTVLIVNGAGALDNSYTLLTSNPGYFSGKQYTVYQVRDDMNCVRQLYYDPNQGGNILYLDAYFRTGSFVGLMACGYVLALFHFFLLYVQYYKMDLARVMAAVQENPLNVNQLVRMIMLTLGFSSLMGFHFAMFGSFYMLPDDPCVAAPRLPAGRWVFSGKANYYLLFIIAMAGAAVAILYLALYDVQRRMTVKTLLPLFLLYLLGVGLRGFGGFAANSFREGWLSFCGVLPQFLQLIVFILAEVIVDVPFWCRMRYKRYRSRHELRYSQEYSATDSIPVEQPMHGR